MRHPVNALTGFSGLICLWSLVLLAPRSVAIEPGALRTLIDGRVNGIGKLQVPARLWIG